MNNQKDVYVAGPFFNPEQISVISSVEEMLTKNKITFFSPRLECLCPPDADFLTRQSTFEQNLDSIKNAKIVIARVDDYDAGTMWEAGYAHALNIPVIFYTTKPGRNLNLMLAQGAAGFAPSLGRLELYISEDFNKKHLDNCWAGEIE